MLWKTKQFSTQKNLFINHSQEFNIKELFNLRVQSIWKRCHFYSVFVELRKTSFLSWPSYWLYSLLEPTIHTLTFLEMVLYKISFRGGSSIMYDSPIPSILNKFRWHLTFSVGFFLNKNFGGCWQCVIGFISVCVV